MVLILPKNFSEAFIMEIRQILRNLSVPAPEIPGQMIFALFYLQISGSN